MPVLAATVADVVADLGPCPKCGCGAFFSSGCTACGYLPGMPVRMHTKPIAPEPAPIEIVRAMQHSQAKPWKRPLPRWLKGEGDGSVSVGADRSQGSPAPVGRAVQAPEADSGLRGLPGVRKAAARPESVAAGGVRDRADGGGTVPGPRPKRVDLQAVRRLQSGGMPLHRIAQVLHIPKERIRLALGEAPEGAVLAGVVVEKGKPGRPGKRFDPEKAKALRDKGMSIRGIALKLGVSVKRVRVALFGPRMASPVPLRAGPHVVPPSSDGCCSSCGAPALPAHQHEIFWELVSEGVAVRRAREIAVMVDKVAQRG